MLTGSYLPRSNNFNIRLFNEENLGHKCDIPGEKHSNQSTTEHGWISHLGHVYTRAKTYDKHGKHIGKTMLIMVTLGKRTTSEKVAQILQDVIGLKPPMRPNQVSYLVLYLFHSALMIMANDIWSCPTNSVHVSTTPMSSFIPTLAKPLIIWTDRNTFSLSISQAMDLWRLDVEFWMDHLQQKSNENIAQYIGPAFGKWQKAMACFPCVASFGAL